MVQLFNTVSFVILPASSQSKIQNEATELTFMLYVYNILSLITINLSDLWTHQMSQLVTREKLK